MYAKKKIFVYEGHYVEIEINLCHNVYTAAAGIFIGKFMLKYQLYQILNEH